MDTSTLNLYIVGGFLLLNLIIGLWAGRGIKDIRDYAVGKRMYGVGVITITFLATYFEGDNIFNAQRSILSHGLIAGLGLIFSAIMFLYAAKWIAPRIVAYKDCYTLGDLMGVFYGKNGEIISGIIGSVYCIIILSIQVIALGRLCESLLGWSFEWSILVGGSVIIIYSSFGGIRAVTITDILQFTVFIILIPIIVSTVVNDAGGLVNIFKNIPVDKMVIRGHENSTYYIITFFCGWLMPGYFASPPILQRMLMANSRESAKNILFISSGIIIFVRIAVILACFAVLVLCPDIVPSDGGAFIYVINNYFSPVAKSLSIVGILAILMSTMDSFLNSGGLLLSRNVFKPLLQRKNSQFNELKVVRYLTLFIGIFSLVVAMLGLEINFLAWLAYAVCITVIVVPLLMGLFKLKTDFKSFFIGLVSSFVFLCIAIQFIPYYIAVPIGMLINLFSYLIVHIIINKGIVIRKNKYEEVHWVPTLEGLRDTLLKAITIHIRVNNYLLNQFYVYKPQYVALAFTVCFSYMFPYLSLKNEGGYLIEIIKFVGACFCIALMLKPLWSDFFIKRLHLIWHFVLFYCLPFTNTLLFVINGGEPIYMLNLGLSIVLMSYFVDIKSFVFMNVMGGYMAYIFAKGLPGYVPFGYEAILITIYTYFGASVLGLIFAYNKQKDLHLVKLQNMSLKFREKFKNESLYDSMGVEEKIAKALGSENLRLSESLRDVTKSMQDMIHKVKRGDNIYLSNNMDFGKFDSEVNALVLVNSHIQELANRSKHYLQLNVKSVDMQEFIEEIDDVAGMFIPGDYSMISNTREERIKCDNGSIMVLFYNILEEINKQNVTNSDLIVDFSDTELSYKLSFLPKYEKKIKALRITITTAIDIYPSLYKNSYNSELLSPRDIRPLSELDLPKVESARILAAHYGVYELIDSLEDGYTIICVIPIDLREVRPAPVDIKSTGRIVNMWPRSKELEDQLKNKIIATAPGIDIKKIVKAIDIIKEYHSEQKRKSGEPFYLHPVEVAKILLDYSQNEDLVLAALLHDTLEDTSLHPMDIKTIFGARVAELVLGVTKIDFSGIPRTLNEQENLKYLQQADRDVMIIKLSDRIHNMRTIEGHEKEEKRRKIAQETLDFFVPRAKDLGLMGIYDELKALAEKVLHLL